MSKKLVAYFSASGVTKSTAERLAKAADADLFEIQPLVPYTKADLDWTNKKSRSSVEMSNPDSRPEIANKVPDFEEYDTVFLGFPIWWYVAPAISILLWKAMTFRERLLFPLPPAAEAEWEKPKKRCALFARMQFGKKGKCSITFRTQSLKSGWTIFYK